MKYLLDTYVLIWYIENNYKLSKNVEHIIDKEENDIYVSIVSAWENVVKQCVNKL